MKKSFKKAYVAIPLALLLVTIFAASAIFVTSADAASAPWQGITTGTANVRTGPTTRASTVKTYAAGTRVTVYATVSGQIVWGKISAWYRISSLSSAPRYIYGGLVAHVNTTGSSPAQNYLIVVSLSQQDLHAYLNGKEVYTTLVTTGMPDLATPTGTWHVYNKLQNVTFTSMWPTTSPYYYAPEHVNYALEYNGPLYLHDATWRSVFGPGTNVPHNDPQFGEITGSHGCVNLPLDAAKWLYNWAPLGTTVQVVN